MAAETIPDPEYGGGDVNHVLRTVSSLSDDGDVQLSILVHALVVACLSCGVDRKTLHTEIDKLWFAPGTMVPLPRVS